MNPDGSYSFSDEEKQHFEDLRKLHLRHPRMVSPQVVKLLRQNRFSMKQMAAVRLEWNKLCAREAM